MCYYLFLVNVTNNDINIHLESHFPSSGEQLLKRNTVKGQFNAQVFISFSHLIVLAFIW